MPVLSIQSVTRDPVAGQSVLAERLRRAAEGAGFDLGGAAVGFGSTIHVGVHPCATRANRLIERAADPLAATMHLVWERPGYRVLDAHHGLRIPSGGRGMSLITLNEAFVPALRDRFPAARVDLLLPPVPPEAFAHRPASQRRRDAVFIGRFVPAKGALWLADAWVRRVFEHVPMRLVLCGSGGRAGDSEEAAIRGLATAYPERLAVRPYTGFAERQQVLDGAALAVFPYQFDHLPQALLETMAAGVPVIAADLTELRVVVGPGRTGTVFTPGSVDAMCGAVCAVVSDLERAVDMAEAGRRLVSAQCSFEAVGRQLRAIVGRPPVARQVS